MTNSELQALRETKAKTLEAARTLEAAKTKIAVLEAECAESKRRVDVWAAIEAACLGKPGGENRRAFLMKHVLEAGLAADAVAEYVGIYANVIKPITPVLGMVAVPPLTPKK